MLTFFWKKLDFPSVGVGVGVDVDVSGVVGGVYIVSDWDGSILLFAVSVCVFTILFPG